MYYYESFGYHKTIKNKIRPQYIKIIKKHCLRRKETFNSMFKISMVKHDKHDFFIYQISFSLYLNIKNSNYMYW